MLRKPKITCALLFLLWSGCFPGPFRLMADTQVSISVSENMAVIGDRIHVKLIIKTTQPVDKIGLKTGTGDYDIISQTETEKRRQNEYAVFEKTLDIVFFKTGEFNVGPFTVDLRQNDRVLESRETNSVPVTVKSVLTDEDKDIKPLKPPLEIEGNPVYILKYVLPVLAIIGAILLVIWYMRRRRRRMGQAGDVLLSPLEEFEQSFLALTARDYPGKGRLKEFFTELTWIIKRFLNRQYLFNAEDLTTYETVYRLRDVEQDNGVLDSFHFIMNTSDLVKFARFAPDAGVLAEIAHKHGQLVREYKKRNEAQAAEVKK